MRKILLNNKQIDLDVLRDYIFSENDILVINLISDSDSYQIVKSLYNNLSVSKTIDALNRIGNVTVKEDIRRIMTGIALDGIENNSFKLTPNFEEINWCDEEFFFQVPISFSLIPKF